MNILPIKQDELKNRLFEALKQSAADYADIRFETRDSTSVSYRGHEPEHVGSGVFCGGIARACIKDGWGIVTFDSIDNIETQLKKACAHAALVGTGTTQLADTPVINEEIKAVMDRDFREVPLDSKLDTIAKYNNIVLATDNVISSRLAYSDMFRTVYFASSSGSYFMEERPLVRFHCSAVARKGNLVQTAHDSIASAKTYDIVLNLEQRVKQTARQAVKLLDAEPCKGGKYTVIIDRELGGVFAHEAFGHLSEADFLYENPKMKDLMRPGRVMGAKNLNIIDDGSIPGLIGTHKFDDEGVPTRKTYLIKNGMLEGHLHSKGTAAKMSATPTGNARAIGRSYPPIVRMTNTYITGGKSSLNDLTRDIENGIYACGMQGGQTMMEMFTFSAAHGFLIKNGEITDTLVRDVVLTGNVFETLHNIEGIADDMKIFEKAGGCGKGGQSPLPVTFGAPHMRIRDVTVGGSQTASQ